MIVQIFLLVLLLAAANPATALFFATRTSTARTSTARTTTDALLSAVTKPQSQRNREVVEAEIEKLAALARTKPQLRKQISPGSWRTLWTTVTADSIIGQLLSQSPSQVLSGQSWQTFNKDFTKAENIVSWRLPNGMDLRMCGAADIKRDKLNEGYELSIRGLEFRWGEQDGTSGSTAKAKESATKMFSLPLEARGVLGDEAAGKSKGKFTVIRLADDFELRNGIGTLSLLYCDGIVRITRDEKQELTYVHIKEELK